MEKTLFAAIVGRPNTGKSTLLNAILGQKIAIVSPKPQTTRTRITGILTQDEVQYVFLDTPGIHKPQDKLGSYMVREANGAIGDVDAVLLVVESGNRVGEVEKTIIKKVGEDMPLILVINKTDVSNATQVAETIMRFSAERAWEQAEEFGHSFSREVCFLAVHSTLHLLGYDHEVSEEDEKYMNDTQEEVLAKMGLRRN